MTELVPYTITTEVEKLEDRKVPETFFDLPAGAEQIPDIPPIHNCPVCRARFETLKGVKFVTPDGESVYLCSPECFEKIRAASRRRTKRQSP